jgi:hypothetical protein
LKPVHSSLNLAPAKSFARDDKSVSVSKSRPQNQFVIPTGV